MFPDYDQCEDDFTIWKLYLLADRISYQRWRLLLPFAPQAEESRTFSPEPVAAAKPGRAVGPHAMFDFDTTFQTDTTGS